MVVRIRDLADGADTGAQGALVRDAIIAAVKVRDRVIVSFDGIQTASSSFVSTALAQLLDVMDLDALKARVIIVDSNHQINDMIKRTLTRPQNHHRAKVTAEAQRR